SPFSIPRWKGTLPRTLAVASMYLTLSPMWTAPPLAVTMPKAFRVAVLLFNLGDIRIGDTANITLIVKPNAAGSLVNSATVTADQTDPNGANNTASLTTQILPQLADLALTSYGSTSQIIVGDK